jgi:hypothetical protein
VGTGIVMRTSLKEHLLHFQHVESGRASISALFLGVGIILVGLLVDLPKASLINRATAANATTSVTVLNTPPDWQAYGQSASSTAQEEPGSSTTTPTNVGSQVVWRALANDSSGDNYYLLICKNASTTATANSSAPPTCPGGSTNQWAVSAATLSGSTSQAATTTYSSDLESNTWYAFVCDGSVSNPACNPIPTQGTGTTSSPFAVNHRPTFTVSTDTSPVNPGVLVTWMSTSSDTDVSGTQDTVSLFVCRAADFTGTACGAGGTWCSAIASTTHPACNYTMENPKPDGNYTAFGYIVDNHGFAASGGQQGVDTVMTINNITPSITAASISLLDTDGVGPLVLTSANGQTTGFQLRYTVDDQNSCTTTTNGAEITSAIFNVYRSGVGSTSCQTSGNYNANRCYPSAVGTGMFNYSCTQDAATCSGVNDSSAAWTCTFPLWYIAESTDGTGVATDPIYFAQNWLATAQAGDNNFATSTITEASSGNELNSLLAYDVTTSTIPYGGLQPGQQNDPLSIQTIIRALGNVGLDQTLYGVAMCPQYPSPCFGAATNTIPIAEQRYATSGVAYALGTALLANPGAEIEINVLKTTATTTPAVGTTTWGIRVPAAITLAGSYYGQNTLIGITGESANW